MILFIILIIYFIVDTHNTPPYEWDMPKIKNEVDDKDEAFRYIDNEVRGTFRNDDNYGRGRYQIDRKPTLNGRVDMIEKHLGIKVEVKPAIAEELIVVNTKGKK